MIYLHKLLPLLVLPVNVSLVLVLVGVRFRRPAFLWTGITVLWLCSTPLVGRIALRVAEGRAVRTSAAEAPKADAIVVLSEGRMVAPGKAAISEWSDADRFFSGLELFKAGKAPLLVFTGGTTLSSKPRASLEGDVLAGYAREMGVPSSRIAKTSRVVNTAEEAQSVGALLHGRLRDSSSRGRSPRVLLVTSAIHMPRARMLFERAGMAVTPFPVDFKISTGETVSPLDFIPSGGALAQTEIVLRELYGRLFYYTIR